MFKKQLTKLLLSCKTQLISLLFVDDAKNDQNIYQQHNHHLGGFPKTTYCEGGEGA